MPEGRMLKKVIAESKSLGNLKSDSARLLYTWLIPFLDIEGRHSADPEIIKGHVFPKVKSMTKAKIGALLTELALGRLIVLYGANGEKYLQFTKFLEHQRVARDREADSRIPAPTKENRITPEYSGPTPENSALSKVNISKCNIGLHLQKGADPNPAVLFDFEEKTWKNITAEDKSAWAVAYPACDIDVELARMGLWIISAGPRGHKKLWRKFITSWLSRTQDKGGTQGVMRPKRDLAAETAALEKRYGGGR